MNFNVKLGWKLAKETAPLIPPGGVLLFIGSVAGYRLAPPNALYCVSKASLSALSMTLAKELAPKGIRVNDLAAGPIWTPALKTMQETNPAFVQAITNTLYIKQISEAYEIASVAAFLCSDEAAVVTGETVLACRGFQGRL